MTKFLFLKNQPSPFADLIKHIDKGDCEVKVKSLRSKSWEQLKAIHKLCSLLAPRFTESHGVLFDMEAAKLNVKLHFGYVRPSTHEECLVEAIKIKQIKVASGEKIKAKDFDELVVALKKELTRPKSFADATKEEMIDLINKIEELGKLMGWPEIKLESEEKRALVEYYNNLKQ